MHTPKGTELSTTRPVNSPDGTLAQPLLVKFSTINGRSGTNSARKFRRLAYHWNGCEVEHIKGLSTGHEFEEMTPAARSAISYSRKLAGVLAAMIRTWYRLSSTLAFQAAWQRT